MPAALQIVEFDSPQIFEENDVPVQFPYTTQLTIVLNANTGDDGVDVTLDWKVNGGAVPNTLLTRLDGTALPTTVRVIGNGKIIELAAHSVGAALFKNVIVNATLNGVTKNDTLQIVKKPDSSPLNEDATQVDPATLNTFIETIETAIRTKQQPISIIAVAAAEVEGITRITTQDALTLKVELDPMLPSSGVQPYYVALEFMVQQADGFVSKPVEGFFKGDPKKPYILFMRKGEAGFYSLQPKLKTGIYIVTVTAALQVGSGTNKRFYYDTASVQVTGT